MAKRTVQEVRKAILEVLKDGQEHSYGDLERKVDTNWETIRNHCKDLVLFGAVEISKEGEVTFIKMTKHGREVLKNIK